jgi:hypothetical protein
MRRALGELAQTSGVITGLKMRRFTPFALTEEDSRIWTRQARYAYDGSFFLSRNQDRRDADLMLQAQEVAQFGPAAIELYGIACRGWNSSAYWIEDTADGEGIWQR